MSNLIAFNPADAAEAWAEQYNAKKAATSIGAQEPSDEVLITPKGMAHLSSVFAQKPKATTSNDKPTLHAGA